MNDITMNGTGISRPDFSSEPQDSALSKEALTKADSYMRAIGCDRKEISEFVRRLAGKNGANFTASFVIMVFREAEQAASRKRKLKPDRPTQSLLFPTEPPSSPMDLVERVAAEFMPVVAEAAAEKAVERAVKAIAPALVELKGQGDANEVKIAAVADGLEEVKAKLAALEAGPDTRQQAPARPSRHRENMKRSSSDFHGPFFDDLLAAFSESFRLGHDGDVDLVAIEGMAKKHNYDATLNTIKDMILGFVGTMARRAAGGINYWRVSKDKLEAAITRRATEGAAAPASQSAAQPAQQTTTRKRARRWPRSAVKVKTKDVLRRFPTLTKDRLYQWVAEKKVDDYTGRVDGGHYVFISDIVEKQVQALLDSEG